MHELTEIMRQKDDLISQRFIGQDSQVYPKEAPHLFIENKFVDCFNNSLIENLSTNKINVLADTDVLSQTKLSASVKLNLFKTCLKIQHLLDS